MRTADPLVIVADSWAQLVKAATALFSDIGRCLTLVFKSHPCLGMRKEPSSSDVHRVSGV